MATMCEFIIAIIAKFKACASCGILHLDNQTKKGCYQSELTLTIWAFSSYFFRKCREFQKLFPIILLVMQFQCFF